MTRINTHDGAGSHVVNLADHRVRMRSRVLTAAANALQEVGLESFNATAVCAHAGISGHTFKAHFPSFRSFCGMLAVTLENERLVRLQSNLSALPAPGKITSHRRRAAAVTQALTLECDNRSSILLLHETRVNMLQDGVHADALRNHERRMAAAVQAALRRLVTIGALPQHLATSHTAHMVSLAWENTLVCSALAGLDGEALRRDGASEAARFLELTATEPPPRGFNRASSASTRTPLR